MVATGSHVSTGELRVGDPAVVGTRDWPALRNERFHRGLVVDIGETDVVPAGHAVAARIPEHALVLILVDRHAFLIEIVGVEIGHLFDRHVIGVKPSHDLAGDRRTKAVSDEVKGDAIALAALDGVGQVQADERREERVGRCAGPASGKVIRLVGPVPEKDDVGRILGRHLRLVGVEHADATVAPRAEESVALGLIADVVVEQPGCVGARAGVDLLGERHERVATPGKLRLEAVRHHGDVLDRLRDAARAVGKNLRRHVLYRPRVGRDREQLPRLERFQSQHAVDGRCAPPLPGLPLGPPLPLPPGHSGPAGPAENAETPVRRRGAIWWPTFSLTACRFRTATEGVKRRTRRPRHGLHPRSVERMHQCQLRHSSAESSCMRTTPYPRKRVPC